MSLLNRFLLNGRTAMITGGSRGLGRSMAQALAEAGADLILIGRDTDNLEKAARELARLGRWIAVLPGDVSTPEGAASVSEEVLTIGRPIDILINNVGGRRQDIAIEDYTVAEWQKLFD